MNDDGPFDAAAREHADTIFSYCRYWLGNPHDAEDVTQEVLVRMWKHWDKVNPERRPAWLMRVARNACVDCARKRSRQQRVDTEAESELQSRRSETGDPLAFLGVQEKQEHLKHVIAHLPEPHRSILLMREVQDMKYCTVAEALGIPLNTVKVYLHRARKMLRETLKQSETDENAAPRLHV